MHDFITEENRVQPREAVKITGKDFDLNTFNYVDELMMAESTMNGKTVNDVDKWAMLKMASTVYTAGYINGARNQKAKQRAHLADVERLESRRLKLLKADALAAIWEKLEDTAQYWAALSGELRRSDEKDAAWKNEMMDNILDYKNAAHEIEGMKKMAVACGLFASMDDLEKELDRIQKEFDSIHRRSGGHGEK